MKFEVVGEITAIETIAVGRSIRILAKLTSITVRDVGESLKASPL
jgi:hypothetical protein